MTRFKAPHIKAPVPKIKMTKLPKLPHVEPIRIKNDLRAIPVKPVPRAKLEIGKTTKAKVNKIPSKQVSMKTKATVAGLGIGSVLGLTYYSGKTGQKKSDCISDCNISKSTTNKEDKSMRSREKISEC